MKTAVVKSSPHSKWLVFDIDGCIFDPLERIPHFLAGDHDQYHALWETDKPIPQGIAAYSAMMKIPDARALFVTGRAERARAYTEQQLRSVFDFEFTLLMRPNHISGHDLHDRELKPWLLSTIGLKPSDIFLVFEDRNSVVHAWRELGVMCYQTAWGDF